MINKGIPGSVDISPLATEATLLEVKDNTATNATEAKQDDIITAINNSGTTGGATEAKQDAVIANQTNGVQLTGLVDDSQLLIGKDNALFVQTAGQRETINVTHVFDATDEATWMWNAATDLQDSTNVSLIIDTTNTTGEIDLYVDGIFDSNISSGQLITDDFAANESVTLIASETGGDIDGSTYSGESKSVRDQQATPFGLEFSADKSKMYIVGQTAPYVAYEYSLSTAGDPSTATLLGNSPTLNSSQPQGIRFKKDDGTKFYVVYNNGRIYQWTAATPWSTIGATYDSVMLDTGVETSAVSDIFWGDDGKKLGVVDRTLGRIYEYTITTPWDISTGAYSGISMGIAADAPYPTSAEFSADGMELFVLSRTNKAVSQYNLSGKYLIEDGLTPKVSYNFTEESLAHGIYIDSITRTWYIVGFINDSVYKYTYTQGTFVGNASARAIYEIGADPIGTTRIVNISDTQINPSTETKQDIVIDNQTNGSQKAEIITNTSPVGTNNRFPTRNLPDMTFKQQVQLGLINGWSILSLVGVARPAQGSYFTMWDSATLKTKLTSAVTMYLSSSSALDTMDIFVSGVDNAGDLLEETVTLTGQTPVATTGQFKCVNSLTAITPGAINAGDIYISSTNSITGGVPNSLSDIQSKILIGKNITRNAFYCVPNGYKFLGIISNPIVSEGKGIEYSDSSVVNGVEYNTFEYDIFQFASEFSISGAIFNGGDYLESRGQIPGGSTGVLATYFIDGYLVNLSDAGLS